MTDLDYRKVLKLKKLIKIYSVDGKNIENDTKTIVRTENILYVFWPKLRFEIYPDKCGKNARGGSRILKGGVGGGVDGRPLGPNPNPNPNPKWRQTSKRGVTTTRHERELIFLSLFIFYFK